jgi:hypothetical protein
MHQRYRRLMLRVFRHFEIGHLFVAEKNEKLELPLTRSVVAHQNHARQFAPFSLEKALPKTPDPVNHDGIIATSD